MISDEENRGRMGLARKEGDDFFAWDRGRRAAQRDQERTRKNAEVAGAAAGDLAASLIPFVMVAGYGLIVASLLFWTPITSGWVEQGQIDSSIGWLGDQLAFLKKVYVSPALLLAILIVAPFAWLGRWGLKTATRNLIKAFLVTVPLPAVLTYYNWPTITSDESVGFIIGVFVAGGLGLYSSWLIAFRRR